jgi:hypothetical protein
MLTARAVAPDLVVPSALVCKLTLVRARFEEIVAAASPAHSERGSPLANAR